MTETEDLRTNLQLMTDLLGVQKGGIKGRDLFFTSSFYTSRTLKIKSDFYKEALRAITSLTLQKKIYNPRDEHVFYNPIFKDHQGSLFYYKPNFVELGVTTYGELQDEVLKRTSGLQHNRTLTCLFDRIIPTGLNNVEHNFIIHEDKKYQFNQITNKFLYELFIHQKQEDHYSTSFWDRHFSDQLDWSKIWKSLHNRLAFESSKTSVWCQIHLNFYTRYNYNKWHNVAEDCQFCLSIPTSELHIIFDCPIIKTLWSDLEPILTSIHPVPVTQSEQIFGLPGDTPSIILRNFVTFTLRECILQGERDAYSNQLGLLNELQIKKMFNSRIVRYIQQRQRSFNLMNREDLFEKFFSINNILVSREGDDDDTDEWTFLQPYGEL